MVRLGFTFVILGLFAGLALTSSGSVRHGKIYDLTQRMYGVPPGDGIDTSAFVDALPIPQTIKVGRQKHITITAGQFGNQYYRDIPESQVWGYNGSSPGPTIEVESGRTLEVFWKNALPTKHLLPPDADEMPGMGRNTPRLPPGFDKLPEVRSVVHLHGAAVTENDLSDRFRNNDGWPDNWTVPGETQISIYPNKQTARTLWYHDHAMGTTARNVNAGLAGLYIIRDRYERSLHLPEGKYEAPLVFETRDFDDNGQLVFPGKIEAEVYGSSIPVNGKVWPYFEVEPRKYRFHMLNATNARSITFKIVDTKDKSAGPAFNQIGSDSGFLSETAVRNEFDLNPAERADVIVDFSKFAGKTLMLTNSNKGDAADAQIFIPYIMTFKVAAQASSEDRSSIPQKMRSIARINPTSKIKMRTIVLGEVDTPNQPPVLMLNDKVWDDPIEDRVKLGSTETWQLINTLPDGHPFHIHLVQFQVLERRPFDVEHYRKTKEVVYTGDPIALSVGELGWKDTTFVIPGTITKIAAKFGPYPGKFVFHCHILEHEDMGMMRPFEVVP